MTTQVEFHTGVADDVGFACRLLRKAYHKGARVLVRGPAAQLARLDRELWVQVERDFVPHVRWTHPGTPPPHAARTPLWLVEGEVPSGAPPVLVNLGADAPDPVAPFERVIEILADDEDQAQRGRARWRAYRALGCAIVHHAERGHG